MDVLILNCGTAIPGECQLTGYVGQIECLSFSHGVAQQITGDQSSQKRTSGKPNHQDFTVTKYLDQASPVLIDYCNTAKNIPTVTFTVGQNDNGKVLVTLVYTLTNALVSSISIGGGGGGKPQETVTFNYTAIGWTYNAQNNDVTNPGNVAATWNLVTNATS